MRLVQVDPALNWALLSFPLIHPINYTTQLKEQHIHNHRLMYRTLMNPHSDNDV